MRTYNFDEVAAWTTGTHIEDYSQYVSDISELEAASHAIARRLSRFGIDVYATPNDGDVYAVGEVTGAIQKVHAGFKKRGFLPTVAKKSRAVWVKEIECYLRNDPKGGLARYAVITGGRRIPFDENFEEDAAARISKMKADICRWVNEAREKFGVDVILRTLEIALNRDSAHPHINVIYIPRRKLKPEDWSRFLQWSRRRVAGHWKDCGRIRDVREVIKYCCKLQGRDSIETLSDLNLKRLHGLMSARSTIEASGGFSDFRKKLDANKQRVVQAAGRLVVMNKAKREKSQKSHCCSDRPPPENIILGRQLPRPFACSMKEPVTLVMGLTATPVTGVGRTGFDILMTRRAQATEWAKGNGAQRETYNVHTITPSLQPDPPRHPNVDTGGALIATPYQDCESVSSHNPAPPPPRPSRPAFYRPNIVPRPRNVPAAPPVRTPRPAFYRPNIVPRPRNVTAPQRTPRPAFYRPRIVKRVRVRVKAYTPRDGMRPVWQGKYVEVTRWVPVT